MEDTVGLLRQASSAMKDTFDTINKAKEERQYNEYSEMFRSAESLEGVKAPEGANAKLWNKAMVDHVGTTLAQGELQKQRHEHLKNEMATKREFLLENARQAEALVPTSVDMALDKMMEIFSSHPNGISVKKNPETGMFDFKDEITEKTWSDQITMDDARQMVQALLPPGKYEEMYLTDRSRVTNYNKVALMNPDLLEGEGGSQLSVYTLIDPNTGSKTLKMQKPDGSIADVDPEDILHGKYKMMKDSKEDRLKELGVKKAELQVQRQEQIMRHADEGMGLRREASKNKGAGVGTGRTGKPTAKDEIMSAYGVDEATAMDIIRSDKTLSARLGMAKTEIKEAMLDPQKPEDLEQINVILKRHKVDQLPGHEGYGREKPEVKQGLQDAPDPGVGDKPVPGRFVAPKNESAQKGADTGGDKVVVSRLTKAFPDAPDGTVKYKGQQKYIKVKGQWQRAKDK